MDFMSGSDLNDKLDDVEFFSEKRTQFYAAEITLAVQFLHQPGILHRDLKLEKSWWTVTDTAKFPILDCRS